MKPKLHLLLVEDSEDDAVLIARELQRGGYNTSCRRVDTAKGFLDALSAGGWDLVIADYNLPQFDALEALEMLKKTREDIPFLIVSGAIGEEVAVAAMKSGAHDYLLKNSLARLVPTVQRELREAQMRRDRRQADVHLSALSKLGQSLSAASTPVEAGRVIGNIADELFGWDAFTLDLYLADRDQIWTVLNVDTVGSEKHDVPSTYINTTPSAVARRIIDRGAELILRDEVNTMLTGAIPLGDVSRPSASLMFVPIRNESRVIGVMSVQSYKFKAYDQRTLGTLQTLADYCGGALERIRARDELQTSREQLRALAAHLQSIREEERKLIAREIHDELGQSLTGFKMDLAWMRNRMQSEEWNSIRTGILEKIKVMGRQLDETAVLVRKLCTELRPGVLDDLGLIAALEWQAREYQLRTRIGCDLRLEIGDLQVDPERSTAIFRIFQEILTNVARHAEATRISIVLERSGGDLLLQVKDNGRGIEPDRIAGEKSLGLLGMRERAHILGGEVDITGAPGKGTTVRVTMPLPQFQKEPAATEKVNGCATPAGDKAAHKHNQKVRH